MSWLERSWYAKSGASRYLVWFLLPLTMLFWLVSTCRRWGYKKGLLKTKKFDVPVVVVGNISVGGTGKTPFVIYLTQLLEKKGLKVGIVSRGYGADKSSLKPFPRYVNTIDDVKLCGDEPKLIANRTSCPVYIGSDRTAVINKLIKDHKPDIVISDDGLQHYKMHRDVEVALVDGSRRHGNSYLLPMGPLRESPQRLNDVDCTVLNHGFVTETQGRLFPDYGLSASRLLSFDGSLHFIKQEQRRVHLVSGIGNPDRFLDTAKSAGLNVVSTTWFGDHHQFSESDFEELNSLNPDTDIVLMTEKDGVKCTAFAKDSWYMLPIDAVISSSLEQQLEQLINEKLKQN